MHSKGNYKQDEKTYSRSSRNTCMYVQRALILLGKMLVDWPPVHLHLDHYFPINISRFWEEVVLCHCLLSPIPLLSHCLQLPGKMTTHRNSKKSKADGSCEVFSCFSGVLSCSFTLYKVLCFFILSIFL